jgi:hypothetical protein
MLSQFQRMVEEGFGELDKSGIAELIFKDPHNIPATAISENSLGNLLD